MSRLISQFYGGLATNGLFPKIIPLFLLQYKMICDIKIDNAVSGGQEKCVERENSGKHSSERGGRRLKAALEEGPLGSPGSGP